MSDSGLGPAVDIWHAGLHYDVEKGLFLKVDSSHQVQLGTVYRGRQRLTDQEVLSLYNSLNNAAGDGSTYAERFYSGKKI